MRASEFIVEYKLLVSKDADGVAVKATAGGKNLGHAEFFFDEQGHLDPQTVWVDERYHGQGIARDMYDHLKDLGYTIVRSWDQTDAGKGFWDKHRGEDARVWETEQTPAEKFIADIYDEYPQTFQNNHVMPFGSEEFAMFELKPSTSKRGAVEVYWFQAYPLRSGVGSRAMQVLQDRAREHGVALTLVPWDKGQVSQAALTKFYKRQGFKPIIKGGRSLSWEPLEEISRDRLERYLSRAGRQVDSRQERMARARQRLSRSYEIYHAEEPAKIVDRFEADTPADAQRYYQDYIERYESDRDYDLRLRRGTGIDEQLDEGFSNDMSTEDMIAYLRQHHDTNLHQDYLDHVNTFSKFVLKDIPTNSISTELSGLDRAKVERYKQMGFSKAPPIVIGNEYILDGYHRATAAKELGIPTIQAYVGVKKVAEGYTRKLNFDEIYGKYLKVTDNNGDPNRSGFSLVTPLNGDSWNWRERPEFIPVVKKKLNQPGWLGNHKYQQIIDAMAGRGFDPKRHIAEFAPSPERDDNDDVPDPIFVLANRWWNAAEKQPQIESVLNSMGWSIHQVESEDDAVQLQHRDGTSYFISADDFDPDVFENFAKGIRAYHGNQGGIDTEQLHAPMWFTDSRPDAEYYAGDDGYVVVVDLDIQNPYVLQPGDEANSVLRRWQELQAQGYDGIHDRRLGDWIPLSRKQIRVISKDDTFMGENFADGKKPGRKGLSRRVGIPKKATLAQLQKIASSSTGERRRMAQWQLNMRRGKAKKNK
jgi:GNAT superfamily N-acetyltransferase